MNDQEKRYGEIFYKYLDEVIDFKKYDEMIDNSSLYFGESNDIDHNISTKYFTVLNRFYIDELLEKDINLDLVKSSYVDVLKKGNDENIMYNPPMPEHIVKNGSLVLEFVYGKNTVSLSGDEYVEHIKKQREFINKMIEVIKKDIKEKLGLECSIFVSKRIRV